MTNVTDITAKISDVDDYDATLDRLHDIVVANSAGLSAGRQARLADVVLGVTDQLMKIVQRPDEPTNADVVRFTKRFSGDSKLYEYVAVKAGDHWYLSNRDRRHDKPLTWDELLDFTYDRYGSQLTLRSAAGWFNLFTED